RRAVVHPGRCIHARTVLRRLSRRRLDPALPRRRPGRARGGYPPDPRLSARRRLLNRAPRSPWFEPVEGHTRDGRPFGKLRRALRQAQRTVSVVLSSPVNRQEPAPTTCSPSHSSASRSGCSSTPGTDTVAVEPGGTVTSSSSCSSLPDQRALARPRSLSCAFGALLKSPNCHCRTQ